MLVLQADGLKYSDQALIHFNEQAGAEHDGVYDAYKIISASNPELPQIFSYTPTDVKLAVNGMPEAPVVPVGFTALQSGSFTLSAPNTGNMIPVLEDLVTGIYTDLTTNSYSFDYTAGDNEKRFLLHFSITNVKEPEQATTSVYSYQKTVFIDLKDQAKGDIFIYNAAGQLVKTEKSSRGMKEIKLENTGIYMVKVITGKSTTVKKVWIQ